MYRYLRTIPSISSPSRPRISPVWNIARLIQTTHDTSILANAWDFDTHGGRYPLGQAADAKAFFDQWGFVVMTDIMSVSENDAVKQALVDDIHEINPATKHITDVADFPEQDLPTSPNHSFRTTCNIVFGRFANMIRSHTGVRSAFGVLHGEANEKLGCSWDTIFYTSHAGEVTNTLATQLHWDHNGYCDGKPLPLAEDLCVQGVYYASETGPGTPTFVCSPGSHKVWPLFSESDLNPSKAGDKLLNYMPIEPFGDDFVAESGLPVPFRIHVPARSLLLWNSRTCHGNAPPVKGAPDPGIGRVSLAISYGPVNKRTPSVQKDALLKAVGGVRTTHHPTIMLSHDKQGYPVDWTAEAEYEPNKQLRNLHIPINPDVDQTEFLEMIGRSDLPESDKAKLSGSLSISNVRDELYRSYWGLSDDGTLYEKMGHLTLSDLRRLVHPQFSAVQGKHDIEL